MNKEYEAELAKMKSKYPDVFTLAERVYEVMPRCIEQRTMFIFALIAQTPDGEQPSEKELAGWVNQFGEVGLCSWHNAVAMGVMMAAGFSKAGMVGELMNTEYKKGK